MAWGRQSRVVIRTPESQSGNTWVYKEVDVSSLGLEYEVTRSRIFNDTEAKVTIYNANKDFINKLITFGSNLMIYAGYEDEGGPGLIYQGNIIGCVYTPTGTDSVTVIESIPMRSLDKPFTSTPIVLNFPPGTNADKVIKAIGTALGLVPIGLENAASVTFPQGWTYVGPVAFAIERVGRDIMTKGLGLYIDLAQLVVYSTVSDSEYSIAYLSFDSGLLEIQDTTDYLGAARGRIDEMGKTKKKKVKVAGSKKKKVIATTEATKDVMAELEKTFTNLAKTYTAKTLMMPKVTPNSLVHVDTPDVSGLFTVDRLDISGGTTPDSSFTMTMSLVEA